MVLLKFTNDGRAGTECKILKGCFLENGYWYFFVIQKDDFNTSSSEGAMIRG